MAYRTVTGTIRRIKDNSPWANARVNFILMSFGFNSTDDVIYPQSRTIAVTNASGEFSVSLWVSEASVSEAIYKVIFPSKESHEFFVPAGAGSINIATLLEFYSPANLPVQPSSFLTYVEGLIDAHIDDKANPHETTLEKARTQENIIGGQVLITRDSGPIATPSSVRLAAFVSTDALGKTWLNMMDNTRIALGVCRDMAISVFVNDASPPGSWSANPVAVDSVLDGEIVVTQNSWARADDPSKMPAIGIVLTAPGSEVTGQFSYRLMTQGDTGPLPDLDLSAFSNGDEIYIAPAGGYTNIRPSHPSIVQKVGIKLANDRMYVDFTKGIQGDHNGTTATTFAFGATTASSQVLAKTATAQRTATFPDKSGTVAMTDDVAAKADISDGVDANFAIPTGNIIVAGAGTAAANGTYEPDGTLNGKARFTKTGGVTGTSTIDGGDSILWDTITWFIFSGGGAPRYSSTDDVATPDLVTTWITDAGGTAPVPTVTAETSLSIPDHVREFANGTTIAESREAIDINVYRGQFHFSTPAATTIAVAGTFVKAAGTTTADALVGMTHADNRLTNTSGETRRFLVQANISITDGTGSKLVNLRLAKDGTTIEATQVDANTGAHDLATVSAAWMVELADTEYVEIWIANETDTDNLTVTHGTLTAYSIDS